MQGNQTELLRSGITYVLPPNGIITQFMLLISLNYHLTCPLNYASNPLAEVLVEEGFAAIASWNPYSKWFYQHKIFVMVRQPLQQT